MGDIFISHSSRDNDDASALHAWLVENNWNDIFLDFDEDQGIVGGTSWQKAIKLATHKSCVAIFLLSKNWLNSHWSNTELITAIASGRPVIGLKIDDIDIRLLPGELIAEYQVIDLLEPNPKTTIHAKDLAGKDIAKSYSESGLRRLFNALQLTDANPDYFPWPPENEPERSPYPGLRSLDIEDAGIFFGRDADISNALSDLRCLARQRVAKSFVVLGASGSGKSSFVAAGLIPRLMRERERFVCGKPVRPDHHSQGIGKSFEASLWSIVEELKLSCSYMDIKNTVEKSNYQELERLIRLVASKSGSDSVVSPKIVVTIDQAETLFVSGDSRDGTGFDRSAATRPRLIELLSALVERCDDVLLIVYSIRSSDFEKLQTCDRLNDPGFETYNLEAIPRGAFKEIIEGPTRRAAQSSNSVKLAPDLVERLLREVNEDGSKDSLPLLAYLLRRMYDEFAQLGEITTRALDFFGGFEGAIRAAVERALEKASNDKKLPRDRAAQLQILKNGLIPWLVGLDPASKEPRRYVCPLSQIPREARPMILLLVNEHLLSADIDRKTGEQTVEPAHEALIRSWSELEGWMKEDLPYLASQEIVKYQTTVWDANARSDDRLSLRANTLTDAVRLRDHVVYGQRLSKAEIDYINECRKVEMKLKTRRIAVSVSACFAVVIALLGTIIAVNRTEAARLAHELDQARVAFSTGDFADVARHAGKLLDTDHALDARDLLVEAAVNAETFRSDDFFFDGKLWSDAPLSDGKIIFGSSKGMAYIFDFDKKSITPFPSLVEAEPDNQIANDIIKVQVSSNERLALLHRNGTLKFYQKKAGKLEPRGASKLQTFDQTPKNINVTEDGLTWAVLVGNSLRVTRCQSDGVEKVLCRRIPTQVKVSKDAVAWEMLSNQRVRWYTIEGGKIVVNTVRWIRSGHTESVKELELPNTHACNGEKVDFSVGKGVLLVGTDDCFSVFQYDRNEEQIAHIISRPQSLPKIKSADLYHVTYPCREQAHLCFLSLSVESGFPLATELPLRLPEGITPLGVFFSPKHKKLILAYKDGRRVRNEVLDLGQKRRFVAPSYNGSSAVNEFTIMDQRVVSLVGKDLLEWGPDRKTSRRQVEVPTEHYLPNSLILEDIAKLPDQRLLVVFRDAENSDRNNLAVLHNGVLMASLPLDRKYTKIAVWGSKIALSMDEASRQSGIGWFHYDPTVGLLKQRNQKQAHKSSQLDAIEQHGVPWGAVYSPDGSKLYVSHDKGAVLAWDADGGQFFSSVYQSTRKTEGGEGARNIAIDPTGAWLLTTDNQGALVPVIRTDRNSGLTNQRIVIEKAEANYELSDIDFAPNGRHIAFLSVSGRLDLYAWSPEGQASRIYSANIVPQQPCDCMQASKTTRYFDLEWIDNTMFAVSGSAGEVRFFPVDVAQITEELLDG